MGVTSTNFAANATNTLIGTLTKERELGYNAVRVDAFGTFGGGTMTFAYSPDNGTTKIPLKASVGGSAISFTSDEGFNFELVLYNDNALLLYATLSGATSPDIDVKVSNPHEA